MKSSRAFTLIELLVVIAIIGILMALLFPAINAALDTAKKTQAKNDVTQIATAVIAYETEYGKLPSTNAGNQTVGSPVLAALMGSNVNSLNPRQIVFLEVNNAKKGKSGISNNNFVDPWGQTYQIVYDDNYDNSVAAGTNGEVIRKKVGVWNDHSGVSTETAAQKKRRSVNSWE